MEIGLNQDLNDVIEDIVIQCDVIPRKNAFAFYFAISGLDDRSMLSREHYEDAIEQVGVVKSK